MMESQGTVVTRDLAGRIPSRAERLLLMPAVSDWLLAGYFLTVVFGLSRAPAGGERNFLLGLSSLVLSTGVPFSAGGGTSLPRLPQPKRSASAHPAHRLSKCLTILDEPEVRSRVRPHRCRGSGAGPGRVACPPRQ